MLLGTPPPLTRHHFAIPPKFCSCKVHVHPFVPVQSGNGHFVAHVLSLGEDKLPIKWKTQVWSCGSSKSEDISFHCAWTLDLAMRGTGALANGITSLHPRLVKMQPILGSFVVEALTTVMPKEKTPSIMTYEHKVQQDLLGNVQIETDQFSLQDASEIENRESKRRIRIGDANKGKVPWNKGKRHSPETLALIRERTIQAMQDPKVRQKLSQCTHLHSDLSKARISASMRKTWEKRRKKKLLQKTCILEWEESIAETSRRGCDGEEELNWDSYEILKEKLSQEWLLAMEMKKAKAKEKCRCKRAGKSDHQKLKISEAIKAKWADPDYRQRVQAGMHRFHGNILPPALERATEKWFYDALNGEKFLNSRKLLADQTSAATHLKPFQVSPCRRKQPPPPSSDPFPHAKLEIVKQEWANRTSMDSKRRAATERARLLIAEAEKAAKVLEPAAVKDVAVRASLYEIRKLLAEAIQSMQSAESSRSGHAAILPWSTVTSTDAKIL